MLRLFKVRQTFLVAIVGLLLVGCGQAPRSYLDQGSSSVTRTANIKAGRCHAGHYIVVRGNSLSQVAQKCNVSLDDLARENNLYPPYILYPGQELALPGTSRNPNINSTQARNLPKTDWRWPVDTALGYDYVRDTAGISGLEIYAEVGTLVRAVAAGEVVYAENSISNFGLMVIIRHDDDFLTVYAHNQRLQTKEGAKVEKGQVIAHVGNSGATDRSKLYFEARHLGRKVNAQPLLKAP